MIMKENFQVEGTLDVLEEDGKFIVNPGTRREVRYDTLEYQRLLGPDDQIAEEFYVVSFDGRYGIIDKFGKLIVRVFYDEFMQAYPTESGALHFKFRMNQKYGIVTDEGKIVIPFNYEAVEHFLRDYAVCDRGKWGMTDDEGHFILRPKYESFTYPNFQFNYGELGKLQKTMPTNLEFFKKNGDVIYECSAIKVWRYIGISNETGKCMYAENVFVLKEKYLENGLYTFRILVFYEDVDGISVMTHPISTSEYIEEIIKRHHLEEYIIYSQ